MTDPKKPDDKPHEEQQRAYVLIADQLHRIKEKLAELPEGKTWVIAPGEEQAE